MVKYIEIEKKVKRNYYVYKHKIIRAYLIILILLGLFYIINIALAFYKFFDLVIQLTLITIEIVLLLKNRKTIFGTLFSSLIVDTYKEVRAYHQIYLDSVKILGLLVLLYFLNVSSLFLLLILTGSVVYFVLSLVFDKLDKEDSFRLKDYMRNIIFLVILVLFLFGTTYRLYSDSNNYLIDKKGEKYSPDFWSSMYFSGVTFFSLGYGDITPYGSVFRMISIFEVFLGIFVIFTFFASGVNIIRERINKKANQMKWMPIKNEALKSIASKLRNLSLDVSKLFEGTTPVIEIPRETSREESIRLLNQEHDRIIQDLSEQTEEVLFGRVNEEYIEGMEQVLEGGYYGLFNAYQEDLNSLELKYGNYLEPNKRLILIKLQKELDGLMFAFKTKGWFEEGRTQFKNILVIHSKQILRIIVKSKYV